MEVWEPSRGRAGEGQVRAVIRVASVLKVRSCPTRNASRGKRRRGWTVTVSLTPPTAAFTFQPFYSLFTYSGCSVAGERSCTRPCTTGAALSPLEHRLWRTDLRGGVQGRRNKQMGKNKRPGGNKPILPVCNASMPVSRSRRDSATHQMTTVFGSLPRCWLGLRGAAQHVCMYVCMSNAQPFSTSPYRPQMYQNHHQALTGSTKERSRELFSSSVSPSVVISDSQCRTSSYS